jgi:hypothetical protein
MTPLKPALQHGRHVSAFAVYVLTTFFVLFEHITFFGPRSRDGMIVYMRISACLPCDYAFIALLWLVYKHGALGENSTKSCAQCAPAAFFQKHLCPASGQRMVRGFARRTEKILARIWIEQSVGKDFVPVSSKYLFSDIHASSHKICTRHALGVNMGYLDEGLRRAVHKYVHGGCSACPWHQSSHQVSFSFQDAFMPFRGQAMSTDCRESVMRMIC